MVEQLLLSGNIDEKELCGLNISHSCFDIGVALLSHSGSRAIGSNFEVIRPKHFVWNMIQ